MVWIAVAIVLAALILRVPGRYEVARHLALIAEQKAALALSTSPASDWRALLSQTTRLVLAARVTQSRAAIEAASTAALIKLNVKVPNAR